MQRQCVVDCLFQAVWSKDPRSVSDTEHEDFYKFIANAFDQPRYHLHYRTDAPLDIKALFYVPNDKPSELHTVSPKLL